MLGKGAFVALVFAVAYLGCGGPKYPNCDDDAQCNTDGRKGVCVDHKCVACRSDDACEKGQSCVGGQCVKPEGYCDDKSPCPGGAPCDAHKCGPVAARAPVECDDDHPCGAGDKCQNGHCVGPEPGGPGCTAFAPPGFAFESAELDDEAKRTLQRLAGCMTSGSLKDRKVLFTGHCDARGEYEFNMGLGAERAERVKTFLISLGVPESRVGTSSRGKLDAVGADESGYARDRRVDVEVR